MKTKHIPQQSTGTVTTYNYNSDDGISSVVDARGASTNYVYNDPRGLVTQINDSSPNPTQIPVTPTVNFSYDNMGNRTSMADGLGSVTYAYNELSEMTSRKNLVPRLRLCDFLTSDRISRVWRESGEWGSREDFITLSRAAMTAGTYFIPATTI